MTPKAAPQQAEREAGRSPVERCEIARWRGYLTSAFYARRIDDGTPVTGCSESFRRRGSSPPAEEPAARSALNEVVAALEQAGWLETGRGDEWFARRFERIVAVPTPEPFTSAPDPAVEPNPPAAEPVAPSAPTPTPAPTRASVAPPAPRSQARPRNRDGRGWQIAALAALPAAFVLLGWLVAGGG